MKRDTERGKRETGRGIEKGMEMQGERTRRRDRERYRETENKDRE